MATADPTECPTIVNGAVHVRPSFSTIVPAMLARSGSTGGRPAPLRPGSSTTATSNRSDSSRGDGQAGQPPFDDAVGQSGGAASPCAQQPDRLVGEHAVRAAAVRDHLDVAR